MGNDPAAGKGKRKKTRCGKISVTQIEPCLPQEIWRMVFDTMPIHDKLSSSKIVVEFGEFYSQLLSNYERYAADFRDIEVEKFARYHLKEQPDKFDAQQIPSLSFSIYLSKPCVTWIDEDKTDHRYLTWESFEDDEDSDLIKYSTYLFVRSVCWLRFNVDEISLPTGHYKILFKVRGPCHVENEYKVTVRHSLPDVKDNVGFIDVEKLKELDSQWQWVPVYKDQEFDNLMVVGCNYEAGDRLSVELFNNHPHWTSDLCFHVIRFIVDW